MEQRTPEWFAERCGEITASRMSDVMAKKTTAAYNNYIAEIVAERLTGNVADCYTSADMQWGNDNEPEARAAYEAITGVLVEEVGFMNHPTITMSGASPDGFVSEDGLIEIKCPKTATHINTIRTGKIPNKYIYQMQWQMGCTSRKWCDFVSYDPRLPMPMCIYIHAVSRDEDIIKSLETEVMNAQIEIDNIIRELKEM